MIGACELASRSPLEGEHAGATSDGGVGVRYPLPRCDAAAARRGIAALPHKGGGEGKSLCLRIKLDAPENQPDPPFEVRAEIEAIKAILVEKAVASEAEIATKKNAVLSAK